MVYDIVAGGSRSVYRYLNSPPKRHRPLTVYIHCKVDSFPRQRCYRSRKCDAPGNCVDHAGEERRAAEAEGLEGSHAFECYVEVGAVEVVVGALVYIGCRYWGATFSPGAGEVLVYDGRV